MTTSAGGRKMAWDCGVPRSEAERAKLGEIQSHTFFFPADRIGPYHGITGHQNLRVIRSVGGNTGGQAASGTRKGGAVAGGLSLVHMGQYFGGRAVRMTGIAAVAIDPPFRAHGAASALMRAMLREMHGQGVPISSLYPATQPVYRRVGYEQAGGYYRVSVPAGAIDVRDKELVLRAAEKKDDEAIAAAYRAKAAGINGYLERTEYVSSRIRKNRDGEAKGYVVERGAGGARGGRRSDESRRRSSWASKAEKPSIEGYVFVQQKAAESRPYDLHCTDLAALTPGAARRLLSFFADHRSMAGDVTWFGSPADPVLAHLREQTWSVALKDLWMLRIVDVKGALEARGYPMGVTADVELEVFGDDVLAKANNGRFVLSVREGRGEVRRVRGGSGAGKPHESRGAHRGRGGARASGMSNANAVRISINGLAAMYSGHQSAANLRAAGWMEGGGEEEDGVLASVFAATPMPCLADHF